MVSILRIYELSTFKYENENDALLLSIVWYVIDRCILID